MPVHYQVDGTTAATISDSVEQGVRTGALPPGASLPAVRTLAGTLGVSPATVAKAYQGLRQRGVVSTNGRNGTRVRTRPAVSAGRNAHGLVAPPGVLDLSAGEPDAGLLPDYGPHLRRLATIAAAPVSYHGAGPLPELLRLARSRLAADGIPTDDPDAGATPAVPGGPARPADPADPADPGEPADRVDPADNGEPGDRVDPADNGEPADRVDPADNGEPGDRADPGEPGAPDPRAGGVELTVTAGALDGIERLLASHLSPGDRVAVEDPSWANLLDLVATLGLAPVPVPVDDDGPTEAGLRRALAGGARAAIVTTRAQNPTGAAVGAARADALREVLREHPDVLVIEDDHAAELSPVRPNSLAQATRAWAFVRSVSKPFGPDLRLAVLAGDPATVARVVGRMRMGTGWVSTLLQRLVVELWRDDEVAAAIARAGESYERRRTALRDALAARGLAAHGRSGLNVWVPVPDETVAVAALRDAGYAVAPGSLYRLASPPGIRLTVGPLRLADIEPLADAVAAAVAAPTRPAFSA